jgi:hypothetical protein
MTKGAGSKPKTLGKSRIKTTKNLLLNEEIQCIDDCSIIRWKGRLIFGEKRKPSSSTSRHRSTARHATTLVDESSSKGRHPDGETSPSSINLHEWAAWRTQLNEHMASDKTNQIDPKHMRQYLKSNQFYQKHGRDRSTGQYDSARLLFSIPHANIKSDVIDPTKELLDTYDGPATHISSNNNRLYSDEQMITSINSMSTGSPVMTEKKIRHRHPKGTYVKADDHLRINEQTVVGDVARAR